MSEETASQIAAAWDWAAHYAQENKLFDQPMNAKGYPVDGTKPTSASEKLEILRNLAVSYLAPIPIDAKDLFKLCGHGALLCAQCDYIPPSWKV